VIGFEPGAARGAGAFHRLKVRVKGKGRAVSHRTGYSETAAASRSNLARRLTAGEAIAKEVSGGVLDLRVLAVPYRNELGRVSVPVVLEIDGRSLLDRPRSTLPEVWLCLTTPAASRTRSRSPQPST
jgi:hypothetical protein